MGRSLIFGLIAPVLTSCYTLEQAYHFNNAYNSRVKVDGVLSAKEIKPDLRDKLELSRSVLEFAKNHGLNTGGAYKHFIPESSSQVSYLVQAAPVDKLEPLTWWFPFVGSVPYLGYFERERRDEKADALRRQGYDISLGTVGAFSSLGWFDDPIYLSMTKRSDEEFIQMMLHELVHRSFWSKGSVPFNENLAEYVSEKLTEVYLLEFRGGQGIEEMKAKRSDQELLKFWLEDLKENLKANYARRDISRAEKIIEKKRIIELFQRQKFPPLKLAAYSGWKVREWNNASLLGASLYSPDFKKFEQAALCQGGFQAGNFLDRLKKEEKQTDSAELALKNMCPSASVGVEVGH